MATIESVVVDSNTGRSFIIKKEQCIRVNAASIVDFVVFNLDNFRERFDQGRTKANIGKVYLTSGDVLYSKLNHVIMSIVDDTYKGTHDLQYGACSKQSYNVQWSRRNTPEWKQMFEKAGVTRREDLPPHGCTENLIDALRDYGIPVEDIPSPFNLFQSVEVSPTGRLLWHFDRDRPEPGKPAHVDLRAEMDCLVAVSACPEAGKMGKAKSIKIEVFDK